MEELKTRKTAIGGQALIEGIVMRGLHVAALAVRLPNGEIEVTEKELKPLRDRYKILGLPIIRGMVNFIEAIVFGYNCLMESAEKSGFEDIDTREEKDEITEKENTKIDSKLMTVVGIISSILGIGLSLVLFMYLPALITDGVDKYVLKTWISTYSLQPLFEGVMKIIIFVAYMWIVSKMKDIQRVFMYHGAEHKTIFCYENGLELTVENVRKQSRFHPRCGTSFMFVMMILSIFISTILVLIFPGIRESRIIWVIAKLLVLPLIMGIGYEFIKYAGRHDNLFTKICSAPGLWMQRISTVEPEDDMIEVGIAAFKYVLEHDENLDIK